MTMKSVVVAIVTALLFAIPGSTQSAADLLQKGIYAQETAGDLDSAIQIFRQVANPASSNKSIAAQAQYHLVLCMLQRGDRAGAAHEVETLARNFPDQQELVIKARKLLPGGSAALPAPWDEGECSQLNIKRDGVATGEYLYYSIDPAVDRANKLIPNHQSLRWELTTKKSNRSGLVTVDRTTGQAAGRPTLRSNDYVGDPAVEPLAGPAIDIQQSVFAMRRLPLAVGYKTTLTTLPFTLANLVPREVELAVTGIESVQVTAGTFKCYKVSFSSIGQTFWFGVEGSRPLVKFKAGNTEAELVKTWGPEDFIETELAFFREAGWRFEDVWMGPGPEGRARVREDAQPGEAYLGFWISVKKVYTPAAEIPQALREALPKDPNICRPETIQKRVIGGQQAVSCIRTPEQEQDVRGSGSYRVLIQSESAAIDLTGPDLWPSDLALYRWRADRVLATAKRIP